MLRVHHMMLLAIFHPADSYVGKRGVKFGYDFDATKSLYLGQPFIFECEGGQPQGESTQFDLYLRFKLSQPSQDSDHGFVACYLGSPHSHHTDGLDLQTDNELRDMCDDLFNGDTEKIRFRGNFTQAMATDYHSFTCAAHYYHSDSKEYFIDELNVLNEFVPFLTTPDNVLMTVGDVIELQKLFVLCESEGGVPTSSYRYGKSHTIRGYSILGLIFLIFDANKCSTNFALTLLAWELVTA